MAVMTQTADRVGTGMRTGVLSTADPSFQAYKLLHIAFIVAPTLAGLDKFFRVLTSWDQYLAPSIARLLPVNPHGFMLAVGVIEIAAGLLVALKPRIGAYVVAAWLAGIVINLLLLGHYFDVALRDIGLMLGALTLGRLSEVHERGQSPQAAI